MRALTFIDASNRFLGRIAAWCALAMLLLQVASVILRYVFSVGLITFQEGVIYGHAFLFLLGAAYVLQVNEHVRVDIFYLLMGRRTRKIIDLVSLVLFIAPVTAMIAWVSIPYVMRSWATLEGSRQAGGLPFIYILKTAIVVFALSVFLQAIATALRIMTGNAPTEWDMPDHDPTDGGG